MQVWITSLLGVISGRFPIADEYLLFIRGICTRRRVSVKEIRALFGLLAGRRLAQAVGDRPRAGRFLAIGVAVEPVRSETWVAFERRLDRAGVLAPQRPDYHKWVRFYLDFRHQYGHPPGAPTSLGPFVTKLPGKGDLAIHIEHIWRLHRGVAGNKQSARARRSRFSDGWSGLNKCG